MEHAHNELNPEWAEAQGRLCRYLQALAVAGERQRDRIVRAVIHRAMTKWEKNPSTVPTVLAMEELRSLTEQWFTMLLPGHERVAVVGLVALFSLNMEQRWPDAFLANEIPADFYRALRDSDIHVVPGLRVSSMVPQPFSNPLDDIVKLSSPLEEVAKGLAPFVSKVFAWAFVAWTMGAFGVGMASL